MRDGEKNGRSKLTWEIVRELRKQWKLKTHRSSLEMSLSCGVSQSTMHDMLIGKTWVRE